MQKSISRFLHFAGLLQVDGSMPVWRAVARLVRKGAAAGGTETKGIGMKRKIARLVYWTLVFIYSSLALLLVGFAGAYLYADFTSENRHDRIEGWMFLIFGLICFSVFVFFWADENREDSPPSY